MTSTSTPLSFSTVDWDQRAALQWTWVESVGWHNKTDLEAVALIASEVGELAAELLANDDFEALQEEAADIALRLIDLIHPYQLSIADEIQSYYTSAYIVPMGEQTLHLMALTGRLANLFRGGVVDTLSLRSVSCEIIARLEYLLASEGSLLPKACEKKFNKNQLRGTRGRVK